MVLCNKNKLENVFRTIRACRYFRYTVFPHIVSSLEYFPPLNSFLTSVRKLFKILLHKGKINEETIWNFQGLKIPKKNSCRGNYMRKYGSCRGNFLRKYCRFSQLSILKTSCLLVVGTLVHATSLQVWTAVTSKTWA